MRISPASGRKKPAISRSIVVLPQPRGPASVVNRPSGIPSDPPAPAVTGPKRFVTASNSTWALSTGKSREEERAAPGEAPGGGDDEQGEGQKGGRQRGRGLQAVIPDQTENRKGGDLSPRRDEEDRDAQVGDRADEGRGPGGHAHGE